ncbi:hypothetical protein BN59_01412 [Legionella massiliensis]|uniref:Uncharacterized protein n=1 Tax=Legionella massiliensis TaxID=1034943 RepID=A0A078KRS3_9GAMM|nr:hypothetical protein [Legionella massiliensis]CDZ77130.1 hypothetical protein BN59_01412 [Legionella massiliensis]CEE12868.1 hypothetical protein BN1094_01412 [Legionella massiliensis]
MFKNKCKTESRAELIENSASEEETRTNKKPGFFNRVSITLGGNKDHNLTKEEKAAKVSRIDGALKSLGL